MSLPAHICMRCGTPTLNGMYCGRSVCGVASRFDFTPNPNGPLPPGWSVAPLTVDDVRRIVREELAAAPQPADGAARMGGAE